MTVHDHHYLGRVPEVGIMAIAVVLGCWACWAGVVTYLINGRKSASLVTLAKSDALPRSDRA
jgi:hypothetical protein